MACPPSAGTCCTGAALSGIPTRTGMRHGSPAHGRQHRNRRDELNNTHPNRPSQFFEAQLAEAPPKSSTERDTEPFVRGRTPRDPRASFARRG